MYIHVFTLYLYKKYLHVITSVINFCNYIYNYTVDPSLHSNSPLNLPIPNLSLTLPVSNLNNSRSDLQYNMNTISTYFLCKYIVKATLNKVSVTMNNKWLYNDCNTYSMSLFSKYELTSHLSLIFTPYNMYYDIISQKKKKIIPPV